MLFIACFDFLAYISFRSNDFSLEFDFKYRPSPPAHMLFRKNSLLKQLPVAVEDFSKQEQQDVYISTTNTSEKLNGALLV